VWLVGGERLISHLSWTRVAYVFFVLSLLAALVKIGVGGAAQSQALALHSSPGEEITVAQSETTSVQHVNVTDTSRQETSATAITGSRKPAFSPPVKNGADPNVEVRKTTDRAGPDRTVSVSSDEPPVFYRPTGGASNKPTGESGTLSFGTGPVCGDLGNFPNGSKVVFPLADTYFNSYSDTWGAPRPQGSHEGTDLMVPAGTPEFAVTDGTIVPVAGANGRGWNTLGGYTVMVQADYGIGPIKQGDIFYYAHMEKPTTLKIGTRVRAGQVLGFAGDTGEGPEPTSGLFPPHLHFGWYDTTGARTSLASGAMNPYPLLNWLKANGGTVAGGSDVKYCEAPQIGPPVPSSGGDNWTYPASPGTRPDIDTGGEDARPSPIVKESDTSVERALGRQEDKPGPQDETQKKDEPKPGIEPKPGAEPKPHVEPKPEITKITPDVGKIDEPKLPPKAVPNEGSSVVNTHDLGVGGKPGISDGHTIRDWVHGMVNRILKGPAKKPDTTGDHNRYKPKPDIHKGKHTEAKKDSHKKREKTEESTNQHAAGCKASNAKEACDEKPKNEKTTPASERTTPKSDDKSETEHSTETTAPEPENTEPAPAPEAAPSTESTSVTEAAPPTGAASEESTTSQ